MTSRRPALSNWLATQADARATAGLQRQLHPQPPAPAGIDLAGNDYLGLRRHPRVVEGAVRAARTWGAGAGASRLVTGALDLHAELERQLAAWCRRPAALVTSTGYAANLAAVTALADADTLIVSDAHVHASLVDGCRLARAAAQVVPHLDLCAVESALASRTQPRALVLVESVWSVLGDASPLPELLAICERHDATLLVDEAHAVGVTGAVTSAADATSTAGASSAADATGTDGRGLAAALHPAQVTRLVVTVTLSKALGSQGGAVLADPVVLDHLVNTARPFIFDTGLAPAAAGAARAALAVLTDEPQRVERLRRAATRIAEAVGVDPPAGAVTAVPMVSATAAVHVQGMLADQGVRVGCFRPPSVPDQIARLRVTASAALSDAELNYACAALARSVRQGPVRTPPPPAPPSRRGERRPA